MPDPAPGTAYRNSGALQPAKVRGGGQGCLPNNGNLCGTSLFLDLIPLITVTANLYWI